MPIPTMHQPTPTGTRERHHAAPQGGAADGGGQRPPPPRASPAPSTRPRNPAQLTSFCPAPSKHLGKPANGSPGRELQLSTSCNPRILQGRGMFDGKAFLLGEGFSRGGSLFLIIFKLWYKRTPNGETEARTPSATAPNLPGLCIEVGLAHGVVTEKLRFP